MPIYILRVKYIMTIFHVSLSSLVVVVVCVTKVFDLNQCYGQMRQWVLMAQAESRGATSSCTDASENTSIPSKIY